MFLKVFAVATLLVILYILFQNLFPPVVAGIAFLYILAMFLIMFRRDVLQLVRRNPITKESCAASCSTSTTSTSELSPLLDKCQNFKNGFVDSKDIPQWMLGDYCKDLLTYDTDKSFLVYPEHMQNFSKRDFQKLFENNQPHTIHEFVTSPYSLVAIVCSTPVLHKNAKLLDTSNWQATRRTILYISTPLLSTTDPTHIPRFDALSKMEDEMKNRHVWHLVTQAYKMALKTFAEIKTSDVLVATSYGFTCYDQLFEGSRVFQKKKLTKLQYDNKCRDILQPLADAQNVTVQWDQEWSELGKMKMSETKANHVYMKEWDPLLPPGIRKNAVGKLEIEPLFQNDQGEDLYTASALIGTIETNPSLNIKHVDIGTYYNG